MKILLFARSYKDMAGGIEKKSLEIAAGLAGRGHQVSIVSLDSFQDEAFYKWPAGVAWYKADIGNPLAKASVRERLRRLLFIRNLLKQDVDIAIGFQVGAFALLRFSAIGLRVKVIAAERNAPTLFEYINRGKLKRFFSNLLLLTSSRISILFPEFKRHYPKYLQAKLVVTPNWVDVARDTKPSNALRSENQILFVGRFSFQKNVECLVDALAMMEREMEVLLIGSGDGIRDIQARAQALNLNLEFLPPTRDLTPYYKSATLLCLPSRWEGFPNVVAEALAAGLPVVGFRGCAGISELVTTKDCGVLAEGNDDALALSLALSDALGRGYSEGLIASSVSKYTYDNFIDAWEKACFEAVNSKYQG